MEKRIPPRVAIFHGGATFREYFREQAFRNPSHRFEPTEIINRPMSQRVHIGVLAMIASGKAKDPEALASRALVATEDLETESEAPKVEDLQSEGFQSEGVPSENFEEARDASRHDGSLEEESFEDDPLRDDSLGDAPSSSKNPLFEDRVPRAAATQLAAVLAWLVECELATLERHQRLKSSSKRETNRHREICQRALRHCFELGVQPRGLGGNRCTRLKEKLSEWRSEKGDRSENAS